VWCNSKIKKELEAEQLKAIFEAIRQLLNKDTEDSPREIGFGTKAREPVAIPPEAVCEAQQCSYPSAAFHRRV
jgi:hypothetical protein